MLPDVDSLMHTLVVAAGCRWRVEKPQPLAPILSRVEVALGTRVMTDGHKAVTGPYPI